MALWLSRKITHVKRHQSYYWRVRMHILVVRAENSQFYLKKVARAVFKETEFLGRVLKDEQGHW